MRHHIMNFAARRTHERRPLIPEQGNFDYRYKDPTSEVNHSCQNKPFLEPMIVSKSESGQVNASMIARPFSESRTIGFKGGSVDGDMGASVEELRSG